MLPKQLFYVTNDQLCAYQWRAGRLSAPRRFAAGPAGFEEFGQYLGEQPEARAYIVADLVEEDFQRQLMPHVTGRARRELVGRRLQHLYRETPYRQALVQGRESEGRRDDQVLLSALTNPAAVQPWVLALEQRRIALAALYSAPFVSALLVAKLAMAQDHLLLITHQSTGLRQSYFQGLNLKFSRLTELAENQPSSPHVAAETARMQQFLTSTRLLARGDLLHVVVLAPEEQLPALESYCEDGPEVAFHFIGMAQAAARLRLANVPPVADQLLLALVAAMAPASHFPLGAECRFYQLWQTRVGLYGASAALALGAALWVADNLWDIVRDGRENTRLLQAATSYDQRYRTIMASMPPAATRTANMKAAVQLESTLRARGPAPGALMALLSQALDRAPAVKLNALDWKVVASPLKPAVDGASPVALSSTGVVQPPAQLLQVDGELMASQGNYREMLDALNGFVLDLRRQPGLAVEVMETPLDIRSNVKLSGKAGPAELASAPRFSLVLSWRQP